jgi:type IV pilus assembly protein PilE
MGDAAMPTTTTRHQALNETQNPRGLKITMQRFSIRTIQHAATKSTGFSLIEMMIVVLVVAILVAIALPAYQTQMQESRRTSAKTGLLDVASREEKYFSTNNVYTGSFINLGYPASATSTILTVPNSSAGYYNITIALTGATTGADFTATATPISTQTTDVCDKFTITDLGVQGNSGGTQTTGCW